MTFSNLEAPYAALRVCVDRYEDGHLSGLVFSQRLTAPLPFTDIGALVLRLDEVLDCQQFPQAFQQIRSFSDPGARAGDIPAAAVPDDGLAPQTVAQAQGAHATFVVNVVSRRSATWQGWIDWLDGGPRQRFSSVLELIRMVEEHLK